MQTRRSFLATGISVAANSGLVRLVAEDDARITSRRPAGTGREAQGLEVLMPRNRVPLSFVIDDSTCLVNMGHFCTPQFAEALPHRTEYKKPWREWPREIPDQFVRKFGEWCADRGVRGKYSIVPYPACVGWVDREMPGWSRHQLQESLKLVRELMVPNWDIHPEMITHTRVIDLKTGRPMNTINAGTMENSYPQEKKSVDELASYLAYALRILERCELPCEGITTPGGFGNLVKSELSLAVDQAVRDVYAVDLPHYFKYVRTGDQSTEPILEHLRGVGTDGLRLTVNVPAGTGDWFGGWQGDRVPEADRYCNQDATAGRMVELIERRQPAIMLCHWPGIYSNGTEAGFKAFQKIVTSIEARYRDRTLWMKLSEIGRYWAARELTRLNRIGKQMTFDAPFAVDNFTFRIANANGPAHLDLNLNEVTEMSALAAGTWYQAEQDQIVCINLPRGRTLLQWD